MFTKDRKLDPMDGIGVNEKRQIIFRRSSGCILHGFGAGFPGRKIDPPTEPHRSIPAKRRKSKYGTAPVIAMTSAQFFMLCEHSGPDWLEASVLASIRANRRPNRLADSPRRLCRRTMAPLMTLRP